MGIIQEEEKEIQQIIIFSTLTGLLGILVFAVLIYRNQQKLKVANHDLEEVNEEVLQKNEEINQQKEEMVFILVEKCTSVLIEKCTTYHQ